MLDFKFKSLTLNTESPKENKIEKTFDCQFLTNEGLSVSQFRCAYIPKARTV